MAEEIYLYCLSRPEGIAVVESMNMIEPVFCREFEGIIAVFGYEDSGEFTPENLAKLGWVGARAAFHEKVVESVMAASPVVPVRFGTFFLSVESLAKFVSQNFSVISRLLDAFCGKSEWSVKGFLDEISVKKRFMTDAPEIPASPGTNYLRQKRLDEEARAKIGAFSADLARSLDADLSLPSLGKIELKLSGPSRHGERMIFHKGFLVQEERLPEFRNRIEKRREEGVLRIELLGPWPPHHFCPDLIEPGRS